MGSSIRERSGTSREDAPARLEFASVDATVDPGRHAEYLTLVAGTIAELRAETIEGMALRPGARLLDAGCGAGEFAIELAPRVLPGGEVVGVDASREMVERASRAAAEAGSAARFLVADVRALSFDEAAFDAVRCERVLQHLVPSDAATAVRELVRVTRPGGMIQLIDVDHDQTAFTASDAELVRRLVVESRADARFPDAGLFVHALLIEAGVRDVSVIIRGGVFRDLGVFDTVQQLEVSMDGMVASGALAPARADALREDLSARAAAGSFLGTIIAYVATGRKA